MAYIPTEWEDGENKYDLTTQDGTVIHADVKLLYKGTGGTPVSATNMNKIEQGIAGNVGIGSYLAFCGNVNANMLDAAFGKNNEDSVIDLGRQLAMYAWFKGANKSTYPFASLLSKNTMADVLLDPSCISGNVDILSVLSLSPYVAGKSEMIKFVAALAGYDATGITTWAGLFSSLPAMTAICGSALALNLLAKLSNTYAALIANITHFNSLATTMLTTLTNAPNYFTAVSADGSLGPGTPASVGANKGFLYMNTMTDAYSSHAFTALRHLYDDATEIVHPAFPASTGTIDVKKFGIGGAKIYGAQASYNLSWVATNYVAV